MNQYIELKNSGKSVKEICEITNKSSSYVYARLDPEGRIKARKHLNNFRSKRINLFKNQLGGKCFICGYSRCTEALEFHHKNQSDKLFEISDAVYQKLKVSEVDLKLEVNKCVLLCCLCHREIHAGIRIL